MFVGNADQNVRYFLLALKPAHQGRDINPEFYHRRSCLCSLGVSDEVSQASLAIGNLRCESLPALCYAGEAGCRVTGGLRHLAPPTNKYGFGVRDLRENSISRCARSGKADLPLHVGASA